MKQSTAWVVSFFASGAIIGGILAILFSLAESDKPLSALSSPGGTTLAPAAAPETLSPDDH